MKTLRLIFLLIFFASFTYAQNSNIGQFAVWKTKEGQLQNFENGYKQHLNWHKSNDDKWGWYGWFIISGNRYGQFLMQLSTILGQILTKPLNLPKIVQTIGFTFFLLVMFRQFLRFRITQSTAQLILLRIN